MTEYRLLDFADLTACQHHYHAEVFSLHERQLCLLIETHNMRLFSLQATPLNSTITAPSHQSFIQTLLRLLCVNGKLTLTTPMDIMHVNVVLACTSLGCSSFNTMHAYTSHTGVYVCVFQVL